MKKHLDLKKESTHDLFDAVMAGKLADIKRLVQAGVKVNARKDHFTPLMFAALQGNVKIAEHLIKHGADINARNDIGQTALMIAAVGGHKLIIQQLIVAGADIKAVDNNKRGPIAWAASRGDFSEVISLLGIFGADYNSGDSAGLTPLMRAALNGYANSVGMLLTLGADEKIKCRGKTAYEMALEEGHKEVCKMMKAILANRPKGHAL